MCRAIDIKVYILDDLWQLLIHFKILKENPSPPVCGSFAGGYLLSVARWLQFLSYGKGSKVIFPHRGKHIGIARNSSQNNTKSSRSACSKNPLTSEIPHWSKLKMSSSYSKWSFQTSSSMRKPRTQNWGEFSVEINLFLMWEVCEDYHVN